MSKILILTEDYPSNENKYPSSFIHSRNLIYLKNGFELLVLSFNANKAYKYEGIDVISLKEFEADYQVSSFDLVLSHAPNLRHHVVFLNKHQKKIKKVVFFIHGHEVLKINKYYPNPYSFDKNSSVTKDLLQNFYDTVKLLILKRYFKSLLLKSKAHIVFVSEWMKTEFIKNVKIDDHILRERSSIIHNNINEVFEVESYIPAEKFLADVITIRPLDKSKYAIDVVAKIAEANPNITFHVYGKGEYFNHYQPPENLVVFNQFLSQKEIPKLLNQYRCALMPTRLDSQGVMMCEMAAYGIPLITSNISICQEMMKGFSNTFFIHNDLTKNQDITTFISNIDFTKEINKEKFSLKNTVFKEIDLIKKLIED
ncbi:glycosyltransferase family 4 protein [Bacillus aquiflavi]|uniref:Glycosyltransferase family 4 protein n=1 Tax=Bacillus aquiflavi TaxID=2672567 RepID=A0A6B3VVU1_9BACI|nr:glycosyltransferase family 4 protein [Bacillus aquiflavi]MBA4538061.1 glycosyltransferase family 4 protein [Bacillus aquiflavi]NEY82360.1 glycosyltransferase family 4 protein [Bacillus aquiflavi]